MSFEYKIKQKIGVVSKKLNGDTLELNLIQYGKYPAKYDLRRWSGGNMLKGLTMDADELTALKTVLKSYNMMIIQKKALEA
ncbi:MAG: hypothetical protein IKN71_04160 [Alphaproteobacteria bacterium]|nr:hypothetical protein [Alphaproteobacteria bacterium]